VSKHVAVLSDRSSAARVSKSAQVNAADNDEDSDAETRQFKRKSKKLKKGNRGSGSSFGMTGSGDDSDDAGDDEDDKRIRKAFHSATSIFSPLGMIPQHHVLLVLGILYYWVIFQALVLDVVRRNRVFLPMALMMLCSFLTVLGRSALSLASLLKATQCI